MPLGRYIRIKILDETAAKLAEIAVTHDLESIAETVNFTVDTARNPKLLSEGTLDCLFQSNTYRLICLHSHCQD